MKKSISISFALSDFFGEKNDSFDIKAAYNFKEIKYPVSKNKNMNFNLPQRSMYHLRLKREHYKSPQRKLRIHRAIPVLAFPLMEDTASNEPQ